jgi:hypothetical protein
VDAGKQAQSLPVRNDLTLTIGPLFWIGVVSIAVFVISSGKGWILSRRFLRGYFALRALRVPTLKEALGSGEGQTIEFKRRLSDGPSRERTSEDEVLKSVAAFANTNDGAIFIGVDDINTVKHSKRAPRTPDADLSKEDLLPAPGR